MIVRFNVGDNENTASIGTNYKIHNKPWEYVNNFKYILCLIATGIFLFRFIFEINGSDKGVNCGSQIDCASSILCVCVFSLFFFFFFCSHHENTRRRR